jgi:1,4-dihydroxy-2-naphthoate octaprenyltransferase
MTNAVRPNQLLVWIAAIRPKTLGASLCPVLVGATLARVDGVFKWDRVLVALAGALLLQIASNLANDLFDGLRGTDGATRVGPQRAVGSGLVTPRAMVSALGLTLVFAALPAAWLAVYASPVFLAIGMLGAMCAVGYTAPPLALAYRGLGDVFVFLFFGPIAVAGTRAACDGAWTMPAFVCGLATGAIGVCLLATNNLRDEVGDRASGKRTIVVRFGAGFVRNIVKLCINVAIAIPIIAAFVYGLPKGIMVASLVAAILGGGSQASRLGFGARLAMFGLLLYAYGIAFAAGSYFTWGVG